MAFTPEQRKAIDDLLGPKLGPRFAKMAEEVLIPWPCAYCGQYNEPARTRCRQCGAPADKIPDVGNLTPEDRFAESFKW